MAAGAVPAAAAPASVTPTSAPQRKVIAATGGAAVGSAAAVVLTWILVAALKKVGVEPPAEVSAAFNTIFTTISAFAFGYYTSPGANEVVVQAPGGAPVSASR